MPDDRSGRATAVGAPAISPPYRYPPLLAAALAPLSLLPFARAFLLWSVIGIAALAVSIALLNRLSGLRFLDPRLFWVAAVFVPSLDVLYTGQFTNLILLGVVGFLYYTARSRSIPAGFALAGSLLLKPFAAPVFALLLWQRRLRALLFLTAAGAVLALRSLLAAGPDVHRSYAANAIRLSTVGGAEPVALVPTNQSLAAFFGRLLTATEYGPSLVDAPAFAAILTFLTATALVVAVLRVVWRSDADGALAVALVLIATALAAPIGWSHDEGFALVALTLAWRAPISNPSRAVLVLAFLLIDAQGLLWHRLVGETALLSLGTYGLLMTFAVTLRAIGAVRSAGAVTVPARSNA